MTATKRGRIRNTFDDYPTPAWALRRLLEVCPLPGPGGYWIEPCAGWGNLALNIRRLRPDIQLVVNDIQPVNRPKLQAVTGIPDSFIFTNDTRTLDRGWLRNFEVFITNPPFDVAFDIAPTQATRFANSYACVG